MKTFNLKLILLCTVLSLVANGVFSQNKNQVEMLQGKKWVLRPSKSYCIIMEFHQSEGSKSLAFNNEEHRYAMLYYLSDSIPKVFDHKKLGKTTCGKYLVQILAREENKKENYKILEISEIIELTYTSLKIKPVGHEWILEYKAE